MAKEIGPRINSGDIVPEIREMAVSWNGHYSDAAIWNTMKLASDVQYVCIDLMQQLVDGLNEAGFQLPGDCVENFFKDKKHGL